MEGTDADEENWQVDAELLRHLQDIEDSWVHRYSAHSFSSPKDIGIISDNFADPLDTSLEVVESEVDEDMYSTQVSEAPQSSVPEIVAAVHGSLNLQQLRAVYAPTDKPLLVSAGNSSKSRSVQGSSSR